MTSPGNHEEYKNFTHYKNRLSMPMKHDSLYWSLDVGLVHFVAFDTEVYYFDTPAMQSRMVRCEKHARHIESNTKSLGAMVAG
jgi:hypothetical protein